MHPMSQFGSLPDKKRRREIAKLRAKGLTFQVIADRLGVSRQPAHEMFWAETKGSKYRPGKLHCARCERPIQRRGKNLFRVRVLYLDCIVTCPSSLGQRLRAARVAAGLSALKLARQLGLSPECIRSMERNQHEPNAHTLEKIVAFCDTILPVHGASSVKTQS
jgi:transcriptional regulator with XRE-family HTH domain